MNSILVDIRCGSKFYKSIVPKVLKNNFKSKLLNKKYNPMFDYIKENFKISKSEFINELCNSIIVSKYSNSYIIIYIDNNIYLKNNKLESIISLIDFGNRDIKGLNIINSSIKYINSRINVLYEYYVWKGGVSYLWQ